MRTTVTLDPDVAAKIKAEMKRTGKSFKEVLNGLIRIGSVEKPAPSKPFRIKARDLGAKPGVYSKKIDELLAEMDAEGLAKK